MLPSYNHTARLTLRFVSSPRRTSTGMLCRTTHLHSTVRTHIFYISHARLMHCVLSLNPGRCAQWLFCGNQRLRLKCQRITSVIVDSIFWFLDNFVRLIGPVRAHASATTHTSTQAQAHPKHNAEPQFELIVVVSRFLWPLCGCSLLALLLLGTLSLRLTFGTCMGTSAWHTGDD